MAEKSWFDLLYDEFKARGEATFAFSPKQVEEAFEGDLKITYEQAQKEWVSLGMGLIVKRSVYIEFRRRMVVDRKAWENRQPAVTVQYVYTDTWDRPCYKVVDFEKGAPVTKGQVLKDVMLQPIGEALTLNDHVNGEPNQCLNIRVVYAEPLNTTEDVSLFAREDYA